MYFVNYKLAEGAKAPHKRSDRDVGYDLFALENHTIYAGVRQYVPVGVHLEMPSSIFAFLTNTSTLGSKGLICLSHIIDSGYRGDVGPILYNLSHGPYVIKAGDKVAQIILLPNVNAVMSERVELGPGNREDKKF